MANNNDALIPEFWAAEALELMYENFLWGNLVYRDYEDEVAKMGDTVHVHSPAGFVAERKQNDTDTLVDQDANSVDIPVLLDQRVYVSFLIGDGERSKSMKSLVDMHLAEAMAAKIRFLDRCVAARSIAFLGNSVGSVGGLSTSNGVDLMIDADKDLNDRNVPEMNRVMMLGNNANALMLKNDKVANADFTGTPGSAVRRAFVGQLANFDVFRSPNCPSVSSVATGTATAINNVGGYAAGTTVFTVDTASPAIGTFVTIAGDNTILRVSNAVTTTMTTNRATNEAVADDAVVTVYGSAAVNLGAGYASGWAKWIEFDGGTVQVGQIIGFANDTNEYVVTQVSGTKFMLDRPLEDAIVDDEVINLGPPAEINFGFNRKAIALVNRPLELPIGGTGVRAASLSDNGYGVRVTIAWDSATEAHRVTVGSLFGIKDLSVDRGVVLLG